MNLLSMVKHIELWLIDKLIPFARNPRTHSDEQIAQIAASIKEFGFNNPILVDTKAGILAGHGRLLAARKLELREVPVIVLDHFDRSAEARVHHRVQPARTQRRLGRDPSPRGAGGVAARGLQY
jgi:hypothetical protein